MADYPQTTWRLIETQALNGAMNMAVDEAILEAVINCESPPTLRLYAWNPPCLSLGIAQPAAEVNVNKLTESGWDLVRRPTGGRAILHTDELTYSVIGPISDPRLAGGVLESYRNLSAALPVSYTHLTLPTTPYV
jgi:lipoate-protein ligase A